MGHPPASAPKAARAHEPIRWEEAETGIRHRAAQAREGHGGYWDAQVHHQEGAKVVIRRAVHPGKRVLRW